MSRSTPFALAAAVLLIPALPLAAYGAPPEAAAPQLKLSGYDRLRWVGRYNYDLDAATPADQALLFNDMRSYVSLEAAYAHARLVASLDLAGSEFDQGAILGNDNSARQRVMLGSLRQLFLEYRFEPLGLTATLGRQPARLGLGLVSSIHRDMFKLVQALPDLGPASQNNVTAVVVRGAKGLTRWADNVPTAQGAEINKGASATDVVNDPDGSAHELNTYGLVFNSQPFPQHRLQVFAVQQIDSSQAGVYPSKRFLDVNLEGQHGPFKLGAEAAHLGGLSPQAPNGGARKTLDSFALLGYGAWALGPVELGLSLGRGGGDNNAGDSVNNNFQSLFIDESSYSINNLFGNDLHGFDGTDASIGRGAGLANVTFLQPSLTWRPLPDLTLKGGYTKHWATAPQKAGSGVLGQGATAQTALASDVGDEGDLRASYQWGQTTFYGAASSFVPGDVYAHSGWANAAHKLELGTEFKF